MNNHSDLITDDMRACIGKQTEPVPLPEEIGASDVRRFLETVGETNPIYWDEASARQCGYRGRVVPPMLVVQFFRRVEDMEEGGSIGWTGLQLPPGYTNTRNAGHRFEWLRPVYVGDRLTIQQRLTDVYQRAGRAGIPVIYLLRATEIRNQEGEIVVRQTSTSAKLPETAVAEASPQSREG